MSEDDRTVWVGGFDSEVTTEEHLYELFLQAGPLQYVRIPKDRETKKPKNFGFVCFLHDVSVPYTIELLDGITLHDRMLKVQSRHLQQKQRQGLVLGPVGVHSLDPFFGQMGPNVDMVGPPRNCGQQSLMGAAPNLVGDPGAMISHQVLEMARIQKPQQPSLMGPAPNLQGFPSGVITNEVIARAREQMRLLHANQPLLLSQNPMPGVHHRAASDGFGYVNERRHENNNMYGNIGRSSESSRRYENNLGGDRNRHEDSRGRHEDNRGGDRGRYEDNRGRDRGRYEDSRGRDRGRYEDGRGGDRGRYDHGRGRDGGKFEDSRGEIRSRYDNHPGRGDGNPSIRGGNLGPRSLDNDAMQDFKARFDREADFNTKRLAELQQRQGRFDFNRLGPPLGSIGSRLGPPLGSIGGGGVGGSRYTDCRPDDRYGRYDKQHQHRHGNSRHRHDPYSRNGSHY